MLGPNNRLVSNKRRGFEAFVLIKAGSRLNVGSQINARVFEKCRVVFLNCFLANQIYTVSQKRRHYILVHIFAKY